MILALKNKLSLSLSLSLSVDRAWAIEHFSWSDLTENLKGRSKAQIVTCMFKTVSSILQLYYKIASGFL